MPLVIQIYKEVIDHFRAGHYRRLPLALFPMAQVRTLSIIIPALTVAAVN